MKQPIEIFKKLKPENQTKEAYFLLHRDFANGLIDKDLREFQRMKHPVASSIESTFAFSPTSARKISPNHIKYNIQQNVSGKILNDI
jgi:hypothetical protein